MSSDDDAFVCMVKTLAEQFGKELLAARENRAVDWNFAKNALRLLTVNDVLNRLLPLALEVNESYRECEIFLHAKAEYWVIFDFLMTSFDKLNLRDTTLPADLLRHAYYFTLLHEMKLDLSLLRMNFTFPDIFYIIKCLYETVKYENFLLTVAQFRQLLKTPYSIPYPTIEEESEQIRKHVVWCAIREGQERLLSGFLKYGVMFLPTPNYSKDRIRYREALFQLLCLRKDYQPPTGFSQWDIKKYFKDKQKRRVSTALRVLELLVLELKGRRERPEPDEPHKRKRPRVGRYAEDWSTCNSVYFRCLRRAFETIPEPFVSSNEVKKMLRYSYESMWDKKVEICVREIISELEEVYPESKGPLTPRSLQHLSRCQVRENLRQSGNLPHGIKDLGLTTLQKYVALEE